MGWNPSVCRRRRRAEGPARGMPQAVLPHARDSGSRRCLAACCSVDVDPDCKGCAGIGRRMSLAPPGGGRSAGWGFGSWERAEASIEGVLGTVYRTDRPPLPADDLARHPHCRSPPPAVPPRVRLGTVPRARRGRRDRRAAAPPPRGTRSAAGGMLRRLAASCDCCGAGGSGGGRGLLGPCCLSIQAPARNQRGLVVCKSPEKNPHSRGLPAPVRRARPRIQASAGPHTPHGLSRARSPRNGPHGRRPAGCRPGRGRKARRGLGGHAHAGAGPGAQRGRSRARCAHPRGRGGCAARPAEPRQRGARLGGRGHGAALDEQRPREPRPAGDAAAARCVRVAFDARDRPRAGSRRRRPAAPHAQAPLGGPRRGRSRIRRGRRALAGPQAVPRARRPRAAPPLPLPAPRPLAAAPRAAALPRPRRADGPRHAGRVPRRLRNRPARALRLFRRPRHRLRPPARIPIRLPRAGRGPGPALARLARGRGGAHQPRLGRRRARRAGRRGVPALCPRPSAGRQARLAAPGRLRGLPARVPRLDEPRTRGVDRVARGLPAGRAGPPAPLWPRPAPAEHGGRRGLVPRDQRHEPHLAQRRLARLVDAVPWRRQEVGLGRRGRGREKAQGAPPQPDRHLDGVRGLGALGRGVGGVVARGEGVPVRAVRQGAQELGALPPAPQGGARAQARLRVHGVQRGLLPAGAPLPPHGLPRARHRAPRRAHGRRLRLPRPLVVLVRARQLAALDPLGPRAVAGARGRGPPRRSGGRRQVRVPEAGGGAGAAARGAGGRQGRGGPGGAVAHLGGGQPGGALLAGRAHAVTAARRPARPLPGGFPGKNCRLAAYLWSFAGWGLDAVTLWDL